MQSEHYIQYRKMLNEIPSNNLMGSLHILFFFTLTISGAYLALMDEIIFYLIGICLLTLSFINGQVLLHDLGHGHFLSHKRVNHFLGHIVALSPIIPYKPWVLIHGQHHRWSGNKYQDPTMVDKNYNDLKESEIKLMNFCWKNWIPIFALSYSFGSFWNVKKLFKLFPSHKTDMLVSIFTPIVVYTMLFYYFPMSMLKILLPAYYLFLALSEPLLLSQHVHIDQGDNTDPEFSKDTSYHVKDQDIFSRNLVFPNWFSKWILLGFNEHAKHHVFPNLPGYEFYRINEKFSNTVDWKKWYKNCKKVDVAKLLFLSNKDTNMIKDMH